MKGLVLASTAILASGIGIKNYVERVEVDQSITAAREGIVVIRVPGGSVRIEGWDQSEVQVVGTIPSHDDRFDLTSDHGHVEIRVVPDPNADPADTDLRIRVPEGSSLDIETDGADVSVDAVRGVVRLATGTGDIRVAGNPMGIVARSMSGDIDIAAEQTPGIAHSEEGTVRLRGGASEMIADRMNPRMERRLRQIDCRRSAECASIRQVAEQYGRHWAEVGADIGATVLEALGDLDLHLSIDDYGDGFRFEFSGDVAVDTDELRAVFADLEDMFVDMGEEIGETMAELGEELESLGDDLRERHRERHRERRRR